MPVKGRIVLTPIIYTHIHTEPMTDPQSRYLWVMSNRTHTRIPFISRNNNGQNVTKAEASILLTKFENEEPVDAAFIDGLGREELVSKMTHPYTRSSAVSLNLKHTCT